MGKRTVYTRVTPLPSNIPRQLALDVLHSHEEVIKLNPLVTGVKSIEAPRDAASDEFFSQWYEISEIITWGFGMKKKIAFKGVFHDQPWGLQAHVYAPMGTDLRNKYRIGGNQPGEPREARELGVDTPADGLYLREDHEIICSVPLTIGFVKKEMKAATGTMIERLTRKAELLEEGKLHAMFEHGKLKTAKPREEATFADKSLPSPNTMPVSPQPPGSPGQRSEHKVSPALDQQGFGRYQDVVARQQSQRHSSYVPQYQQQGYNGPQYAKSGAELQDVPEVYEMPGSFYQPEQNALGLYPPPLKPQGQAFRSELPGDYTLAPPQPNMDKKRHSAPYPSHPQASPQPSPGMPARRTSNGSSKYSLTNPDVPSQGPVYSAYNPNSVQSSQTTEWKGRLSGASSHDANSVAHSRSESQYTAYSEPDHQRFSRLSMQQTPVQQYSYDPAGKGTGPVSKCPVCGLFEGDEAAVSHHVSKAHFA